MIIVYHSNNKITSVVNADNQMIKFGCKDSIAAVIHSLAENFPESVIIWCAKGVSDYLNIKFINTLFHHNKIMLSYSPMNSVYLGNKIGYVEESPFIKVNKNVSYPTWQMSSMVGGIHASVLNGINNKTSLNYDFDYYLNSIAKLSMPLGVLCYSEPLLLKQNLIISENTASTYTLFRFVKQHYKARWVFLLFFNIMLYEREFPIAPFLVSIFYKNKKNNAINLDAIVLQSSRKVVDKATIDVIIPTIGRKSYLYDVLKDLKLQKHLPTNIIIVEQNPDEGSKSELDYLNCEDWPFTIKHTFTNQPGACNARNIALNQIESEWVFFADDDILIEDKIIQKSFKQISKFGTKAVSIKCFQNGDTRLENTVFQWGSFGSGCSIVFSESLIGLKFKMGYEFGFGEDGDFGMQLRNKGQDILYLPKPKILHLKAPVGGFRTKPMLQWHNEKVQPKPSPTVMLYMILNTTKEQLRGYKTTLFFKYYRHQKIKNPFLYLKMFQKQWNKSLFWANELKNKA